DISGKEKVTHKMFDLQKENIINANYEKKENKNEKGSYHAKKRSAISRAIESMKKGILTLVNKLGGYPKKEEIVVENINQI
nr:hypothetical protein [Lachnospiraceae bacterium]